MHDSPTKFEPTEKMRDLLNAWREEDYACSISEACRRADVHRSMWYEWIHRPGFVGWWLAEAQAHFGGRIPEVYSVLFAAASGDRRGDTSAAKLILERFDDMYAPRSRQEQKIEADVGESTLDRIMRLADGE